MPNSKHLVSLFLVLTISACTFSNDNYLAVDPSIVDMEYSSTQKYVALVNGTSVNIYDSMTFQFLMTMSHDGLEYLGLAFSTDENYISVSYVSDKENNVSLHTRSIPKRTNNTLNSIESIKYDETTVIQLGNSRNISSLCWLGSTYVLFGVTDGSVYIYKPTNGTIIYSGYFDKDIPVSAVSCSQKNSNEFAIAGSNEDKNIVAIFELSLQNEKSEIIEKSRILIDNQINDMFFTKDNNLYTCGKSNIVIQFLAKNNFTTNITYVIEGNSENEITELSKIRATDNDEFFATTSKETLVVINKEKDTKEIFTNVLPTFAFSPTGASILHLFNSSHVEIKSQCKDSEYFDEGTSMCQKCSSTCGKCLKFSNRCFTCVQGYYFTSNYMCSACKDKCEICSSSSNCTKCKSSYTLNNNLCICPSGKFQDISTNSCLDCSEGCDFCLSLEICGTCSSGYSPEGGKCVKKNGLAWFIILLIVIGGVIVVAAIGYVVWSKLLKKRKQNALLDTEDYAKEEIRECPS